MTRFSSILGGCVFGAAALAAQAQTARPTFPARPQPGQTGQQPFGPAQAQQPNPGMNQQTPAGVIQPQVTGRGAAQPTAQQPMMPAQQPMTPARTADNPPTTPPSPPTVTYRDGLLSVQASNSTLTSVLTAIRNKAGIEFEGLENLNDRVALSLGPAPAGEVLSAIFAGSKFDFVAVGRQDNSAIVQRVIMTPKSRPGAVAGAQQQQPQPNAGQEAEEEENNTEEQVNSTEPQDIPVQPIQPPQAQTQNPAAQPQPKTPEQLLQEIQEMRKQQGQGDENPAHVPRKPPQ
jgi:hypothetical protein